MGLRDEGRKFRAQGSECGVQGWLEGWLDRQNAAQVANIIDSV